MLTSQRTTGAGPTAPGDAGRRGRLLAAAVVAAAGAVVLCAALEGAVHGAPAPAAPLPSSSLHTRRASTGRPLLPPPAPSSSDLGPVVGWILLAFAVALGIVLAVVLIRMLVALLNGRRPRPESEPHGRPQLGASSASADATSVQRGIAAALEVLAEDRDPTDSVVRAWLGLQQSAEDLGVTRYAAETPTEFTSRVLARTGAELTDVRVLLALYLRARFGGAPIGPDDAATAVRALRALDESWRSADARAGS